MKTTRLPLMQKRTPKNTCVFFWRRPSVHDNVRTLHDCPMFWVRTGDVKDMVEGSLCCERQCCCNAGRSDATCARTARLVRHGLLAKVAFFFCDVRRYFTRHSVASRKSPCAPREIREEDSAKPTYAVCVAG